MLGGQQPAGTTTQTQAPTGWVGQQQFDNTQLANSLAGNPYPQYGGQVVAPWTQDQSQAGQQIRNNQGNWTGTLGQGASIYGQNAGYQAPRVDQLGTYNAQLNSGVPTVAAAQINRGGVRDVTAQNLPGMDRNSYMNPYTQDVIDTSLNDLTRQNNNLNNSTNLAASAAGAFGGSRSAVLNNLNNESYLRNSGQLSAQLHNQGFDTASGLMEQDANRNLTAQGMNQNMDYNVANQNMGATNQQQQFYSGLGQQSALANQSAINNMGQWQADENLRAQMANQSAGLNAAGIRQNAAAGLMGAAQQSQNMGYTDANALFNLGSNQQGLNQQQNTYNQQQFQNAANWPYQMLGLRQQAVAGAGFGSTSTSPYFNPSTTANVLGTGVGLGQIGNSLFGKQGVFPGAASAAASAAGSGISNLYTNFFGSPANTSANYGTPYPTYDPSVNTVDTVQNPFLAQ